ncbi:MAG: hypothetical protein UZ11_BCD004000355 [Bacteroidetes bacterium OLB11]|nr:MAG: hypothetical protein UZ11_BCD004000355 [Bacteroidetes bacterium OLB11]
MTPKNSYFIYLLALLAISFIVFSSNKNGITGKAVAGCGGNGCHNPSLNTSIQLDGLPSTYSYGTVYNCTLKVINQNKSNAGFDMKVNIGTLSSVAGQGTSLTGGSTEMYHNTPKAANAGITEWAFKWTAPPSGNTDLVVNVAGNAVDNNNQPTNDEFDVDAFAATAPGGANNSPLITNVNTTSITANSAIVNADINANNAATTAIVEYGLTATYGSSVAMSPSPINGANPIAASANLSGLTANTVYHYRIVATNANGTTNSTDYTFQTALINGINDMHTIEFNVYPNPAIDYLYINKINGSLANIYILSIDGKRQKVQLEKSVNGEYKIQMSPLAKGNYVLIMELNGKKASHHFVKQ